MNILPLHQMLEPRSEFSMRDRIRELEQDFGIKSWKPRDPTESRIMHNIAKSLPRRFLEDGLEYAVSLSYGGTSEKTVKATVELLHLDVGDPDRSVLFIYEVPVLNTNYVLLD